MSNCYANASLVSMLAVLLIGNSHCRISEEEYVTAIKEEISKVVKIQEELDIDVLVHGEPEVSSPEAIRLPLICRKVWLFCAKVLCSHLILLAMFYRETIWLSILVSSSLVLHSLPMVGCNLMDQGVSSPQSSTVM